MVAGVITSSGANYLLSLEDRTKEVSEVYVSHAYERFDEYEKILPGIVEYPQ